MKKYILIFSIFFFRKYNLYIIEDARLSDSDGRFLDFKYEINILASNIGSRNIVVFFRIITKQITLLGYIFEDEDYNLYFF